MVNPSWRLREIFYIFLAIFMMVALFELSRHLKSDDYYLDEFLFLAGFISGLWLLFKSARWVVLLIENYTGFKLFFMGYSIIVVLGGLFAIFIIPAGIIFSVIKYMQEKKIYNEWISSNSNSPFQT